MKNPDKEKQNSKEEKKKESQSQIKRTGSVVRQSFVNSSDGMHVSDSGLFVRPLYGHRDKSTEDFQMSSKLYKMMAEYMPKDMDSIQMNIVNHVEYTLARTRLNFKSIHCYQAVAHSIRDRLIESFNDTHRAFENSGKKRVYYFSL